MYEIWSLGHKPFEKYTNPQVILHGWPWGSLLHWWVMLACSWQECSVELYWLHDKGQECWSNNQAAVSGYMKSKARQSLCCSFFRLASLQNLHCLIWWTGTFIVIHCYVYLCMYSYIHQLIQAHTQLLSILLLILPQAMKQVDRGYRLPPPPGCPKALYELMIQCWWVSIATNPTAGIISIPSIVDNLGYVSWDY